MHIRVIAVGDRQPRWVDAAWQDYAGRLPRAWQFTLRALATEKRPRGGPGDARQAEGVSILADVKDGERMIALDERGRQASSVELSRWLSGWQADGRDVCLVIGGPDGLSDDCRARADATWSLSKLTLPHGLARVVMVEQLYRAASILSGHPYHRA